MLTEIVHPGALDTRAQIEEDLTEMKEQLQKQLTRLRELRLKKLEEPGSTIFFAPYWARSHWDGTDAFYGIEDENLINADVMTDATAFTRYTAAPSAASKTSK